MASLWVGGRHEVPWEWIELMFCREIYHCTPAEFNDQDVSVILTHLEMINTERQVEAFQNQKPVNK